MPPVFVNMLAARAKQRTTLYVRMPAITNIQGLKAPVLAAAMAGNIDVASQCLAAGIPVDATDSRGWTALKYAVFSGNREGAELLLEHGADCDIADNEDWTALLSAIENRDLEFVNLLLSKGANPNAAPDIEDDDDQKGFSALMRAAHYGEVEIVEALIAAGADLAQTDSDGAAAVHYAALHRHTDCLELLLDRGADPNETGLDGHTPIGMFLVGLATAMSEEMVVDEAAAIATLDLLLERGGNFKSAAEVVAMEVGEDRITVLDAAMFAAKQGGLQDLSSKFARLVE